MATATELRAKALTSIEAAKAIAKAAEDAGREFTGEERATVTRHFDAAKGYKAQADAAEGDADLLAQVNALGGSVDVKTADNPAGTLSFSPATGVKSTGTRFTESDAFGSWLKSVAPGGVIPESTKGIQSPPMHFRGYKDLVTGASDTSAGALVSNDFRGLLDETGNLQRPLTAIDLITMGTTNSDTVEFVKTTGFTNNAAPVAEASGTSAGTASGDVAGTKPESALALTKVTTTVKTIAHWIPATKRALSDAAQVRTLIDNFLRYGLAAELEDQVVLGNGVGENFTGILNTSGRQTQAWDTDLLTTTRKARTKVRTVGRTNPTAWLLNPADNEAIDLLKDDTDNFYFGGPGGMGVNTLWGLPRVECEAVTAGVGIVADFRMAVLWDREAANISVSDSHADFFVRNLIAILAEMRAAFGVIRPSAFVEIDLTA